MCTQIVIIFTFHFNSLRLFATFKDTLRNFADISPVAHSHGLQCNVIVVKTNLYGAEQCTDSFTSLPGKTTKLKQRVTW